MWWCARLRQQSVQAIQSGMNFFFYNSKQSLRSGIINHNSEDFAAPFQDVPNTVASHLPLLFTLVLADTAKIAHIQFHFRHQIALGLPAPDNG